MFSSGLIATQRRVLFSLPIVCAALVPTSANAQQSAADPTTDEEPVEGATTLDTDFLLNAPVVTASGREQSRALVPANVVTWERDEIYRHGWRTLLQVLANTPGLYVIDDLQIPSLGVRGVGAGLRGDTRLVRIMINGVQVNFGPDLTAFLGSEYIPFTIVERIEIAKGPLSAIYGANAFLATVNVITTRPVNGLKGEAGGDLQIIRGNVGAGFDGTAGYGSDHFTIMGAYEQQHQNRSGLVLHRTFAAQDPGSPTYQGFFDRKTVDDVSKPRSLFGLAEGRSETFGNLTIQGGRQVLDADANFLPGSVLTNQSTTSLYNNWGEASYVYGYGRDVTISANGGVASGAPRATDQLFATGDDRFRYERHIGYTGYDLGAAVDAKLPANLTLKLGTDFYAQRYDDLYYDQIYLQTVGGTLPGFKSPRGTPQKSTLSDFGVYGQFGGNPFETLPDLYLLGNIRFDDPNLFDKQISWRTGVAYQFSPRIISKLFLGRAFQTPSAVQLFAQPGFGNTYNVIGSRAQTGLPALQPQSVISAEFATTIALTDSLVVDSALYLQQIHDKIEFTQISGNFTPRNLANQNYLGGELGLRASSSRLTGYVYGSTQMTKNDNVSQGTRARFGFNAPSEYPVATGFAGLTTRLPEAFMAIDVTTRLIGPRGASQSNYILNNRTNYTLHSYATVDLNVTSLDVFFFGEGYETKLLASVRNIFDARYSDPGHGGFDVPSLGRTFMFRLAQSF